MDYYKQHLRFIVLDAERTVIYVSHVRRVQMFDVRNGLQQNQLCRHNS